VFRPGLRHHGLPVRHDPVPPFSELQDPSRAVVHVEEPHGLECRHRKAPQGLQEPRALRAATGAPKLRPDRFQGRFLFGGSGLFFVHGPAPLLRRLRLEIGVDGVDVEQGDLLAGLERLREAMAALHPLP
jgi:hypothetical protein